VVHQTPTENISPPENKKSHIHMIMEEKDVTVKGYRIDDIAWLKSKDRPLGESGSTPPKQLNG
jgi:hypothetical protein